MDFPLENPILAGNKSITHTATTQSRGTLAVILTPKNKK